LIRDNVTTAVLFMGRIDDPTQSENDLAPDELPFFPDLSPSVSGTVYFDANQDGAPSAAEGGLAGWTVFIDANRNGSLEQSEPQATTAADGSYTLRPSLFSGRIAVSLLPNAGGAPGPSRGVDLARGQELSGVDLGSPIDARPASALAAALDATSASDTVLLRRSGDNVEVFLQDPASGAPSFSQPWTALSSLTLRLLAGDDRVVIDYSGGNPLPAEGLFLDVGSGTNRLNVVGEAQEFSSLHVAGGTLDIEGDPGAISLFVERGATVRLSAGAHLAAAYVADEGRLVAPVDHVLSTRALTIAPRGSLHLNGGPLVMQGSTYRHWYAAQINRYIHSGQLRDETRPDLAALLNDRGDWTPRFETIGGEAVDLFTVVVASFPGAAAGDYDLNGVVDQRDLDLVLLHWGDDADLPLAGWINDLPGGQVDQDDLDAVLLNWGKVSEFLPF
jgi:hypothetical protein